MDTTRLPRWYSFQHRDNEVEVICTSPRRIYERGEYPLATVRHEVFRVYLLTVGDSQFRIYTPGQHNKARTGSGGELSPLERSSSDDYVRSITSDESCQGH